MSSPWNGRTRASALTAVVLAVVVLLLTLEWDTRLVLIAGLLSVTLAGLALQEGIPAGSCPTCRARPRRQLRDEISTVVEPRIDGWVVLITVERLCTNCRESRRLVEEVAVPRKDAPTEAEAIVLARSGHLTPQRIRQAI